VAGTPDDLEDELDPELGGMGDDEDIDEDLDDELPDGFVVEGEDADDAETLDESDEGSTIVEAVVADVVVSEEPDGFEEAPVVLVAVEDDDGEEVQGRRSGEFVCSRCFLVKRNTQLVNKQRRICRDCA